MFLSLLLSSFATQPVRLVEPDVTHLVFSPDSKTLTAAYYRYAMNRPGTDWHTFATTWDVTTGKATVLPDAIGPVAYSPDGKTFASGLVERNKQAGFRQRPYVRLALWTPGEVKPTKIWTAPTDAGRTAAGDRTSENGSVVAFAIHPGEKYVAVASVDQVWWQSLVGKPHVIDSVRVASDMRETRMTFLEDGKVLRLTGRIGDGRGKPSSITWQAEAGDKERIFKEVGREEHKEVKAPEVTAVSPDGMRKATAAGQVVKITDAKTGELLKELKPKE